MGGRAFALWDQSERDCPGRSDDAALSPVAKFVSRSGRKAEDYHRQDSSRPANDSAGRDCVHGDFSAIDKSWAHYRAAHFCGWRLHPSGSGVDLENFDVEILDLETL